jgi:hypothetical protein
MANELKPCPFCGGPACRSKGGAGKSAYFGVGCDSPAPCPAYLHGLFHRTQEQADATWNRRAQPAETVAPLIAERDDLAAKLAMAIELLRPFVTPYEFSTASGIGWPWTDEQGVRLPVFAGAYRRAALFIREQTK